MCNLTEEKQVSSSEIRMVSRLGYLWDAMLPIPDRAELIVQFQPAIKYVSIGHCARSCNEASNAILNRA